VRDRDLATVGERGLERRLALPVYNRDLMTLFAQEPRSRRTNDARSEDENPHA
jgi:hypothetical protein